MDPQTLFLTLSFVTVTCVYLMARRKSRITPLLPPGPYRFPIIGSIFKLGDKPHQALAALSKTYGPLMSLKLGTTTAVVISSPELAKDFFLKRDQLFSSRPIPHICDIHDHHKFSLTFSPVGEKWRWLRKISKELLFSVQNLDASRVLRGEKVRELVKHVGQCAASGEAVDLGVAAFTTTLNVLSTFVFSVSLAQLDSSSSQEFRETISGMMEVLGKPNLADYFPLLRRFDPQGLFRDGSVHFMKLTTIFNGIIDERLRKRAVSSDNIGKDVLDLLLDIHQKTDSDFGRDDIIHLLFELFTAGTDTTGTTLEWAMTELTRNPQKMAKARSEMEEIFGKDNQNIQETDFLKLPYLQAVIKENFRLHPPAPFLVPHKAIEDVEIKGFIVPTDSHILCNVWAMGRDSTVWPSPETFMPERFLDVKMDFKGHDFELIPFGAGRRMCPAMALADRMLHLMLGSLIYRFDWKLEGGMKPTDLDMSEKFGLTIQRVVSLKAVPIKV